jgi:integrase
MKRVLPEVITEEDLKKILEVTKKKHHKLAFAMGFYECMRVSEIIKLTSEDINKDQRLIYIKQAKGHKDRHIPIAPEIMNGLKYLPIKCGIRSLQVAFNKYSLMALNRRLNFHILRHSGISFYVNVRKLSSLQVQRLAGHSRITMTEIYTHVSPQDLIKAMWKE